MNFSFPLFKVIRPQNAPTESSEDNNFMFLTMLTILALTLYVFRPMSRRRQLANSNKPSSSGEVNIWLRFFFLFLSFILGELWKKKIKKFFFFIWLILGWWFRTTTACYPLIYKVDVILFLEYFFSILLSAHS